MAVNKIGGIKMKKCNEYKKMLYMFLSIILLFTSITAIAAEDNIDITSGTYFQLGKYNDNPILWKAVVYENENGILMVSDKILCYKNFDPIKEPIGKYEHCGSNFWEESTLRIWLNSTADIGKINWKYGKKPDKEHVRRYYMSEEGLDPYADSAGFLSNKNFSESEMSAIKTVSHWQALSENKKMLSTNGLNVPYYPEIVRAPGTHLEQIKYKYEISEMNKAYYGAMYRLYDTIFTLDESQLYELWSQFGTVEAEKAEGVLDPWYGIDNPIGKSPYQWYWLRTPDGDNGITVAASKEAYAVTNPTDNELGVRPAFYLNEDNMIIKSGIGTEEDPYILDGKGQENTAIFCNGKQVEFDQQPIEEDDRLLVPVRAIFEQLGAEVTYDDGDGVITANNGERTVVMQIDNPEMGNGTEVFTLDVAPKLVGDRTVVPLRAVSEAFDCRVDWVEELDRVVIDPPQPEDTDEGHYQNIWDIEIHGKGKKR